MPIRPSLADRHNCGQMSALLTRLLLLDDIWTDRLDSDEGVSSEDVRALGPLTEEMRALLSDFVSQLAFIERMAGEYPDYLEENFQKGLTGGQKDTLAGLSQFRNGIVPVIRRAIDEVRSGAEEEGREIGAKMAKFSSGGDVRGDLTLRCALLAAAMGASAGLGGPVGWGVAGSLFGVSVAERCWG